MNGVYLSHHRYQGYKQTLTKFVSTKCFYENNTFKKVKFTHRHFSSPFYTYNLYYILQNKTKLITIIIELYYYDILFWCIIYLSSISLLPRVDLCQTNSCMVQNIHTIVNNYQCFYVNIMIGIELTIKTLLYCIVILKSTKLSLVQFFIEHQITCFINLLIQFQKI